MKRVIFIDDDFSGIEMYKNACETEFADVKSEYYEQPEIAFDAIKNDTSNISLIILDIMFAGDGEFEGGFDRGRTYYYKIKEILPKAKIIIFTNRIKGNMYDFFEEIQRDKNLFIEKPEKLVSDFITLITRYLS